MSTMEKNILTAAKWGNALCTSYKGLECSLGLLLMIKEMMTKKFTAPLGAECVPVTIRFIVANFYMRLFCTLQEKRKAKFAEHFCATPF
jgi:hypothetical protein